MVKDVVTEQIEAEEKANAKMKEKVNRIRSTNSAIIGEIESMGQALEVTMPRLEHFMVYLVELGIITEAQLLDEALKWEYNLKEQLVPAVRAMREKRDQIREEARRQQAGSSSSPGEKPHISLVLPPGVKREKSEPTGEASDKA